MEEYRKIQHEKWLKHNCNANKNDNCNNNSESLKKYGDQMNNNCYDETDSEMLEHVVQMDEDEALARKLQQEEYDHNDDNLDPIPEK